MPRKAKCELSRANILQEIEQHKTSETVDSAATDLANCLGSLSLSTATNVESSATNVKVASATNVKSSATKDKSSTTKVKYSPEFNQALSLIAIQILLVSIPSSAHPYVRDYLFEKITKKHSSSIKTEKFHNLLTHIDQEDVNERIIKMGKDEGIAFDVFLMPPVYKCILVNVHVSYIFSSSQIFFSVTDF